MSSCSYPYPENNTSYQLKGLMRHMITMCPFNGTDNRRLRQVEIRSQTNDIGHETIVTDLRSKVVAVFIAIPN